MASGHESAIQTAVDKAAHDPFFLGFLLEVAASFGRLDATSLATSLGCSVDALTKLYLCRAPREDAAGFRDDVQRIAAFSGCDANSLARLLRHASAMGALRGSAAPAPGSVLLAARDAPPDKPGRGDHD